MVFVCFCDKTERNQPKRKEQGKKKVWQLPWAMPLQCLRKAFLNLLRGVVDVVGISQGGIGREPTLAIFLGNFLNFGPESLSETTVTASSNNNKGPTLTK